MRILLANHFQNARQSIRANRLRSILTMVGVLIGVASITTILSLSIGASSIIARQVDELGGNIAVVRPASTQEGAFDAASLGSSPFTTSSLTERDIATLRDIPHVEQVAPLMIMQGKVSGEGTTQAAAPIVATTPSLAEVSALKIDDGEFLNPGILNATTVIGSQLSIDLFGTEHSIGKTIVIRGAPFTVIGILARTNEPINYNGVNFDAAALINFSIGKQFNQGAAHIQQINVQSDSVANLQGVIADANRLLLRNHLGEADFAVLSGNEVAQPTSQLFTAFAGVSVAIAAISLIVGGVGIMNIMLVSVAERTREIGIRKALGATRFDIVMQFMIESLLISLGGGVLGFLAGYGAAFGISLLLPFDAAMTWEIATSAVVVSLTTGFLFGIYPAARAANKDPISALRQYD
ncbi:ABC transporter permease [Candidatus Saccharibacteria bacterium]|nr:ABC transporter permease [Candidatus Saccharibacteria bacterium]